MFYEQIQSEVYCESGTSFIHVINSEHVIHNSVSVEVYLYRCLWACYQFCIIQKFVSFSSKYFILVLISLTSCHTV